MIAEEKLRPEVRGTVGWLGLEVERAGTRK